MTGETSKEAGERQASAMSSVANSIKRRMSIIRIELNLRMKIK